MATPCANCVYKGTEYCSIFCGKPVNKLLVLLAVLLLSTHSWGACSVGCGNSSGICYANRGIADCSGAGAQLSCPQSFSESNFYYTSGVLYDVQDYNCTYLNCRMWGCNKSSGYITVGRCDYSTRCSTQDEADSIYCELYPNDEKCAVETDTTLWACTEGIVDGAIYSELYRLSCRAKNGEVVSCNGKTNVDISTDGQLVRRMQGTCAANGYTNGIQSGGGGGGGGSPRAQCIAAIGSNCYMRDARSGNTFTCACDGDCGYAIRQMATGECVNPYPQDSLQNDSATLPLPSSSDDWQPSSSAAEPSSAASFANELEGIEKLYGVLDTIRDTLNRKIAPSVLDIQANVQNIGTQMYTANDWLQQIAGKDWNPTINVGAPDVTIQGDTNIINVTVQGDTARAGAAILDWLRDENYSFSNSVDSTYYRQALAEADSTRRWADSVSAYEVPRKDGDSLAAAAVGTRGALRALRDTINGGAFGDSLARWESLITNNGVIAGNGSDNCPSVLTQPVIFRFPPVGDINAGTLGKYICTPIAGINITLWALIRVLLRASVAIACMYWIFKAVTGTDGGEDE